jgi:hypothetical protein
MPHVPPRSPSRVEGDHDDSEYKTVLVAEKEGDIILSPSIPDRGIFGEPDMKPARTKFQQHNHNHDYPPSLSDASVGSSSSHSCLEDDDEPEPTHPTTSSSSAGEGMERNNTSGDLDDLDILDEYFDCADCPEDDNVDGPKSNLAGGLEFLTTGGLRGDIAVVISYAFAGKPKMVNISHSPRSSNDDSRRWGKFVSSAPDVRTTPTPSLESDNSSSRTRTTAPPSPSSPSTQTTPLTPTTTTTCYSPKSTNNDTTESSKPSTWRGLIRSVSRRRRRTPKEEKSENVVLVEEVVKLDSSPPSPPPPPPPPRHPHGLGLKLSRSRSVRRTGGGPPTPVMV